MTLGFCISYFMSGLVRVKSLGINHLYGEWSRKTVGSPPQATPLHLSKLLFKPHHSTEGKDICETADSVTGNNYWMGYYEID